MVWFLSNYNDFELDGSVFLVDASSLQALSVLFGTSYMISLSPYLINYGWLYIYIAIDRGIRADIASTSDSGTLLVVRL